MAGRRKVTRKRGITVTVKKPRWMKILDAAWKDFKRELRNALMGAGLMALIYWAMIAITKAIGGE